MSFTGQVIPAEGLRVRSGPGIEHTILGVLKQDERITLFELIGEWWRVNTHLGPGFVHAAFVSPVPGEPEESSEPSPAALEVVYTCVAGDTLSRIGARFGLTFMEIATLNGIVDPFTIQVGQLLRIPGAAGLQPVSGTISILNPFNFSGQTEVTSSSIQGHHKPWLGSSSCDLDVRGLDSRGVGVHFNVSGPMGLEVRGRVQSVALACRSGRLEDGGRTVKLGIEKRIGGGVWTDTDAWVLYAHLDPVHVSRDQIVVAGQSIGAMGPATGPEYFSSCAQGSHVHVEASKATCVVNERSLIVNAPIITLDG